jgi:hypothetical protein
MRLARVPLVIGLLLMLAAGRSAAEMTKGSSILAIQLVSSEGDFGVADGTGFLVATRHSEMGVEAQYWHLWSSDYAITAAAGLGFSRESESPGQGALPGDESYRDFYKSWRLRVGGDRVGKISDTFHVFAGPGIQVWGGRVEYRRANTVAYETPTTLRYGIDGRIGMIIHWGQNFGMVGQLGHYWAYAHARQSGSETKWLPSGPDGAMGFFFGF